MANTRPDLISNYTNAIYNTGCSEVSGCDPNSDLERTLCERDYLDSRVWELEEQLSRIECERDRLKTENLRLLNEATARNAELHHTRKLAAERLQERNNWEQTAHGFSDNCDYYRGLVQEIGRIFGKAAKTADDGEEHEHVLCAKVPELVAAMDLELFNALSWLRMYKPDYFEKEKPSDERRQQRVITLG